MKSELSAFLNIVSFYY